MYIGTKKYFKICLFYDKKDAKLFFLNSLYIGTKYFKKIYKFYDKKDAN